VGLVPCAGSRYSPALWLEGSAVQSRYVITSQVLVPKLVLSWLGQLPLAAVLRASAAERAAEVQPALNPGFPWLRSSRARGQTPFHMRNPVKLGGTTSMRESSRIALCSMTVLKLFGKGVQLHLQ